MRKLIILVLIGMYLAIPVQALELTAPEVPPDVREFMPSSQDNLGAGLMEVLRDGIRWLRPDLKEAMGVCLGLLSAALITSVLRTFPGSGAKCVDLAGTVLAAILLLGASGSLIRLGVDTVSRVSEYGKLLFPVLTTALAAQGGITSSAAIYAGTLAFDTVLSALIARVLTPLVYLYLALATAESVAPEQMLKKFRECIKDLTVWCLKTLLYIFTGYIGITGVISGSTDALALKAAKMTISGMVPVVGGILADASEAVLVSAGLVKHSLGIYGMFAILSIWIGPFLKIGTQYLLLKATAAFCGLLESKGITKLAENYATAMGLVLAMTGAVCIMLIISTICFMKGAG